VLDECQKINPVSCDNIDLVNDISDELAEHGSRNSSAKELRAILKSAYFRVCMTQLLYSTDCVLALHNNNTDVYGFS